MALRSMRQAIQSLGPVVAYLLPVVSKGEPLMGEPLTFALVYIVLLIAVLAPIFWAHR